MLSKLVAGCPLFNIPWYPPLLQIHRLVPEILKVAGKVKHKVLFNFLIY